MGNYIRQKVNNPLFEDAIQHYVKAAWAIKDYLATAATHGFSP
jgi:hypothetical protein